VEHPKKERSIMQEQQLAAKGGACLNPSNSKAGLENALSDRGLAKSRQEKRGFDRERGRKIQEA